MSSEDVLVPATGNDGELEVIEISVSVGDMVDVDSTIVVLESDKATVEVPSPKSGKVLEISVSVGDKVKEGSSLLTLSTESVGQNEENKETANVEDDVNIKTDDQSQRSKQNIEDILVPDLGGSEQVEIIEISCMAGDVVEKDQTLMVLESDKATMEIPSPVDGTILTVKLKVGDKVSTGDSIAEVELRSKTGEQTGEHKDIEASNNQTRQSVIVENITQPPSLNQDETSDIITTKSTVHAGPSARKFAREHGVDLARVKPSGPKNRILVEDISLYIKSQVQLAQTGASPLGSNSFENIPLPDFSQYGEISVSSLSSIHYKTAENMQRNWHRIPHVTQFDEADISDMEVFRKNQKAIAESRDIKLTPLAFILKACAYVLKALPQFNVSLDLANKRLIQKHFIHIGFAVDTPHGLFVPVIKNVDKKSIWALAAECQELANRAKDKKLLPKDMQGGCFTVSSLGAIGGTGFTPIINAPEVAILGVSKAQMKPVYMDDGNLEARLMLPLSLSYDHRAVNGADGARFTTLLSKVLGDLRELLL